MRIFRRSGRSFDLPDEIQIPRSQPPKNKLDEPFPERTVPLVSPTVDSEPASKLYRVPREVLTELEGARRILIVGHQRPDLDTLGSSLALGQMLSWLGKDVEVCIDDVLPGSLRRFDDRSTEDPEVKTGDELTGEYDLVVLLDVADKERIGRASDRLPRAAKVMVIDHHELLASHEKLGLGPDTPLIAWIDSGADATALLVAGIVERLADRHPEAAIGPQEWADLAIPIAAGILSDTRDFTKPGASMNAAKVYQHLVKKHRLDEGELRALMEYEVPKDASVELFAGSHEQLAKDGSYALLVVDKDTAHRALELARPKDADITEEDLRHHALRRIDGHLETHELSVLVWESELALMVSTRSQKPGPALRLVKSLPMSVGCSGGGHTDMAAGSCDVLDLGRVHQIVEQRLHAFSLARETRMRSQGSL